MNERARRHQHARRGNNQQNSHHQPPASGSGSHQQQQPHHNRSIAYHYGHPADTYSASNYRHPSTTTTATDPSSIAPSQSSGDCAISICYSYLIAIFSSFLVVLGIYLSVTKFNVRFLYISLVGLSIEAVGACVYCVSNIRASKLARRKQRINSDEFIINGGSNLDNNLLATNLNGHRTQNPQRHQQTQQLQTTTVTHILSNRDLTSSNTTNEGTIVSRDNINENSSSAIINTSNTDNTQPPHSDQQATRHEHEGEQTTIADQALPSISPASENLEARDGNSIIVISSPSSQLLIDNQTGDGDQRKDHQADRSDQASQMQGSTSIQTNQVADMTGQVSQQTDTTIVCASPSADISSSNQLPNQDCQQSLTTTSGDFSSSIDLLNNQQEQQSQQQQQHQQQQRQLQQLQLQHQRSLEHSPKHHQRPAHFRRTMVIGLGGEEEMIEIDEQELDNMSILPPSYESITMNDPFKGK